MGLIGRVWGAVFGSGRNVVAETVGVFRENAEAAGQRAGEARRQAMAQYAAEFAHPRRGRFDRAIDGLNRLPRPIMAFGVMGLMVAAMVEPVWFAERMVGLALVPEPMWWLMGAVVSFYFGARTLAQGQEFRRSVAETVARVPEVTRGLAELEALRPAAPGTGDAAAAVAPAGNAALEGLRPARPGGTDAAAVAPAGNAALEEWRARHTQT